MSVADAHNGEMLPACQSPLRRRSQQRCAVLGCLLLLACQVLSSPSDRNASFSEVGAGHSGASEQPTAAGGSMSHAGKAGSGADGTTIAAGGQDANAPTRAGAGTGVAGNIASAGSKASAGGAGAAGDGAGGGGTTTGPDDTGDQKTVSCDLGKDCLANCESNAAECEILDPGFSCEFPTLAGKSAAVACGKRAVVGTACCGGCGCVDVVVYFDGKRCWQGLPDCSLPDYAGLLFYPHASK